jgi:hypothetical protein
VVESYRSSAPNPCPSAWCWPRSWPWKHDSEATSPGTATELLYWSQEREGKIAPRGILSSRSETKKWRKRSRKILWHL